MRTPWVPARGARCSGLPGPSPSGAAKDAGGGLWRVGSEGRLGEEGVDEMPVTPVLGGALVSPQGL